MLVLSPPPFFLIMDKTDAITHSKLYDDAQSEELATYLHLAVAITCLRCCWTMWDSLLQSHISGAAGLCGIAEEDSPSNTHMICDT